MIISCPGCKAQYRIDPQGVQRTVAKVKCPGCGNRFEINLQATAEGAVTGAAPESRGELADKILVVDDARFFREMIKDILGELKIEIIEAGDGEKAWQIITTVRPRMVLLDLNIPGMSGQEILQKLRSRPECDKIKVLAMSSVLRGDDASLGVVKAGADDFINKSFKPTELLSRVRKFLAT